MRFKIKTAENLPREVADDRVQSGHDALRVDEQGLAGGSDPDRDHSSISGARRTSMRQRRSRSMVRSQGSGRISRDLSSARMAVAPVRL